MKNKDCCFQYATATPNIIREDTRLITKNEALAMFERYKETFKDDFKKGYEPEMCIWSDMKNETNFHNPFKYLHCSDCEIFEGEVYIVRREMI